MGQIGEGRAAVLRPAAAGNGERHARVTRPYQRVPKAYGKSKSVPGQVAQNVLLNKPRSGKEVRHYEIALNGSGLTYEAGDALGVVPVNCHELVDDVLAALKAKPDENVKFSDNIVSLREALTHHFDVNKPSQELLAAVAKAVPQNELAALLAPGNATT